MTTAAVAAGVSARGCRPGRGRIKRSLRQRNGEFAMAAKKKSAKSARKTDFWFTFGEQSFVVEDRNGTPVGVGYYAFTRTAWNAGSLVLVFDNDAVGFTGGEIYTVDLKFSPAKSRIIGKNIRNLQ